MVFMADVFVPCEACGGKRFNPEVLEVKYRDLSIAQVLDVGHTWLVIEHNLDVIMSADWVIDMGPGAGHRGGEVVAMGRPEDVARVPESVTGHYLREAIDEGRAA